MADAIFRSDRFRGAEKTHIHVVFQHAEAPFHRIVEWDGEEPSRSGARHGCRASEAWFCLCSHKIAGEQSCTDFARRGANMDVWHENQALAVHDFDSRHRAAHLKAALPSNPVFRPDCGRPSMACTGALIFSEHPY